MLSAKKYAGTSIIHHAPHTNDLELKYSEDSLNIEKETTKGDVTVKSKKSFCEKGKYFRRFVLSVFTEVDDGEGETNNMPVTSNLPPCNVCHSCSGKSLCP